MMAYTLLVYILGFLLPLVVSLPTSNDSSLLDDPCEIQYPNPDGEEIQGCNSHRLAVDGSCPLLNATTDCASFCESRRRWFWGPEVRLQFEKNWINPKGHENVSTIENLRFIWDATSYSITPPLKHPLEVFQSGFDTIKINTHAKYNYKKDKQKMRLESQSLEPWCGYWTFIPMYTVSCGTITQWPKQEVLDEDGTSYMTCDIRGAKTTHIDQCIIYPHFKKNGNPDGHTVVVKTYCDNRDALAPWEEQDPLYRRPGVADLSLQSVHTPGDGGE